MIKSRIFRHEYMLIPVSVVLIDYGTVFARELLIFGVRIAYWTVRE